MCTPTSARRRPQQRRRDVGVSDGRWFTLPSLSSHHHLLLLLLLSFIHLLRPSSGIIQSYLHLSDRSATSPVLNLPSSPPSLLHPSQWWMEGMWGHFLSFIFLLLFPHLIHSSSPPEVPVELPNVDVVPIFFSKTVILKFAPQKNQMNLFKMSPNCIRLSGRSDCNC